MVSKQRTVRSTDSSIPTDCRIQLLTLAVYCPDKKIIGVPVYSDPRQMSLQLQFLVYKCTSCYISLSYIPSICCGFQWTCHTWPCTSIILHLPVYIYTGPASNTYGIAHDYARPIKQRTDCEPYISMAPVHKQWSYQSLALSHRYDTVYMLSIITVS